MDIVSPFQGFLSFLAYFVVAIALTLVFQFVYVKATPYDEVALISKNNVAAAITYTGALIGFVLPLASTIANAVSLVDMLVWGVFAGVAQLVTFFVFRLFYPGLADSITAGELARALKLGGWSIGIGLLNAASLTY